MQLRALAPCCLLFVMLASGSLASADEASGTWSGELEARANYFYERSTRVVMPAGKVSAEAPNGIRISADYLVDVISSASIAQTGGGADAVFTELRHGVGLSLGKTFGAGEGDLDLTLHGRYSGEDDYESRVYGLDSAYSWNEKNSTVRLGVTRVDDTVLSNVNSAFEGELSGVATSVGFSQVISPTVVLGGSYQLGYLQGYLGNAYRRALIGPLPNPEAPPDTRVRHNAQAQISWFIPKTDTTLELSYRAYVDSWDVSALTPELRVYQAFGEDFVVRARYRYYAQTQASFFRTRYPVGYTGPITSDPKLSELQSHQVGLKLEYRLSFFGGGFMDFAKDTWLDLSVDRQFCTSTFGNNIIATAGGRLPF